MKQIFLMTMLGVALCLSNCRNTLSSDSESSSDRVIDTTNIHFDVSYKTMTKSKDFTPKMVSLSDSLEIWYLSTGYNAEYENGGSGFMILLPKDTTVSKICNTKRFSQEQWKLRNELVQKIKNGMIEKAISDDVERYFDVFFYYTRQEYLYINGGAVDDNGIEWPDYSTQDNAPIEEYKLKDGKWVLSRYIPDSRSKTNLQFGLDKAEEILVARFGKMAEELDTMKIEKK